MEIVSLCCRGESNEEKDLGIGPIHVLAWL